MSTIELRKKVIECINHAESNVLEAVYGILKIYEDGESKSFMSETQKSEIDKRSKLFRQGKLKTLSWEDVKKNARRKI